MPGGVTVKTIPLADVVLDPGLQARVRGLDAGHVAELETAYRAGKTVPPGRVFRIADRFTLTRGHHRLEGARRAGLKALPFEVYDGTADDARLDAAASNAAHGLKRSNEDKRRAVEWTMAARPDWTNAEVANHCGVDSAFVDNLRAEAAALAAAADGNSDERNFPTKKRRGPKSKKVDFAARIGRLLKANPRRTDIDLAAEIGCKVGLVTRVRKVLVRTGVIDANPPAPDELTANTPDDEPVPFVTGGQAGGGVEAGADSQPAPPPPAGPKVKNPPIKDGLGNVVPACVADTFGDPMLADAVGRITAAHAERVSIEKHVVTTLNKKSEFWPYAQFGECAKSLAAAADRAAEAAAQLSNGLPFRVCPKCNGEGCKDCRRGGYWTRHRHEQRTQYGD